MAKSNNTNISKSKSKREAQKKQNVKMRRQKLISKVVGTIISVAIVLLIAWLIGKQIYLMAIRTTPNSDYSAGLSADGKIADTDVLSALSLVDYKNISIPEDEVNATEEEVDEEINSMLDGYKELSTDPDVEIADGDEVNIDFVGTVDGVEFDGGNSNGAGYDLTIGSGSFIDDFEEQLIGHKAGENVTVEVTFPEDYGNEELNGKDASFAVTINGIMVPPELTDEFVAENLAESEEVSTAAEYRAKIEHNFYEEHLEEYLTNYVVENSTVNSYPQKYLKSMKAVNKYNDNMGDAIEDEIEYEKELTERAKEDVKEAMVYQAIFESAGLSMDMDAYYNELIEENGEDYANNLKESYGEGYIAHMQMREVVTDYLVDLYK
ncbi:MAG: FKBP-type peptidyl-prolyl cis-trans isomerase [Lachnospiraceae bacterium]|nr:FKBP-type peptidyl-prolyl cis-trans isomerase [Lachnospiraceae bacterium]